VIAYGGTRNRIAENASGDLRPLRDLADQLDGSGTVTLEVGGTTVRVDPTEPATFKLEGESDWSQGDSEAKQSIEFEPVWLREATTAEEGRLTVRE
jgi:amphi-Trp domain-containing protein